jgi:hypothetical protein
VGATVAAGAAGPGAAPDAALASPGSGVLGWFPPEASAARAAMMPSIVDMLIPAARVRAAAAR